MDRRPPAWFFLIGLSSLALLIVGLLLTAQQTHPTLSTILSVLGALGMVACALIAKRHRT